MLSHVGRRIQCKTLCLPEDALVRALKVMRTEQPWMTAWAALGPGGWCKGKKIPLVFNRWLKELQQNDMLTAACVSDIQHCFTIKQVHFYHPCIEPKLPQTKTLTILDASLTERLKEFHARAAQANYADSNCHVVSDSLPASWPMSSASASQPIFCDFGSVTFTPAELVQAVPVPVAHMVCPFLLLLLLITSSWQMLPMRILRTCSRG